MSAFTLQPNKHLALAFTAPWLGPIRYSVEAEAPIAVLVLDEANLGAWRQGIPYTPFGGIEGTTQFVQAVYVKARTTWYFVMANYQDKPVAVWFNVQS